MAEKYVSLEQHTHYFWNMSLLVIWKCSKIYKNVVSKQIIALNRGAL